MALSDYYLFPVLKQSRGSHRFNPLVPIKLPIVTCRRPGFKWWLHNSRCIFIITLPITNIHNARCQMVKDAYDVEAVVTQWLITQGIGLYQEGIDKLIQQCN